jgi:hypothetical protein
MPSEMAYKGLFKAVQVLYEWSRGGHADIPRESHIICDSLDSHRFIRDELSKRSASLRSGSHFPHPGRVSPQF